MMTGTTFERVYQALKVRLRNGGFAPGERLEPALLSGDLNASVTPVRDALHRLVGERLIEAPKHDGFRVPLLTEIGLRHLYGWNMDLLLLALRSARPIPGPGLEWANDEADDAHELAAATEAIFAEIGRRSANPEHAAAIVNANDRLHRLRLMEPSLLENVAGEIEVLLGLLSEANRDPLRRAIVAYHRRRNRAAPHLLESFQISEIHS